uniref:Uncharacterized protein n=1 Tax=Arundo donax TaxID=35708 RepID=A0A0A9A869_ARUDO
MKSAPDQLGRVRPRFLSPRVVGGTSDSLTGTPPLSASPTATTSSSAPLAPPSAPPLHSHRHRLLRPAHTMDLCRHCCPRVHNHRPLPRYCCRLLTCATHL